MRSMNDSLTAALERALAGNHELENGAYPYIAFPNDQFIALLQYAYGVFQTLMLRKKKVRPRFLDVGCGIGTKVFLAREVLRDGSYAAAMGLERHEPYVATARRLLDRAHEPGSSVIHADALTYDGYGEFNLVYFYKPLYDNLLQKRLEQRIVAQLAPRTVVVSPLFTDLDCMRKQLLPVNDYTFIKRAA